MYDDGHVYIEDLKQLFSKDKLFIEILNDDTDEEVLFPPFIKKLMLNKTYNSLEVAKMLKKKDSNIRYYIKELFDYLQPYKPNRNYRHDYKTVYRIYLISYYISKPGRNLSDVKEILYGVQGNDHNPDIEILKEKVATIEHYIDEFGATKNVYAGDESKTKSMDQEVVQVVEEVSNYDKLPQKIIEVEVKLCELQQQHFSLMTDILNAERRLLHLENEFSQSVQTLELNNRLFAIENTIRSLFNKNSIVFNNEVVLPILSRESNLLGLQKEINTEKELLKKLENEFGLVQEEIESVIDLKMGILKGI